LEDELISLPHSSQNQAYAVWLAQPTANGAAEALLHRSSPLLEVARELTLVSVEYFGAAGSTVSEGDDATLMPHA